MFRKLAGSNQSRNAFRVLSLAAVTLTLISPAPAQKHSPSQAGNGWPEYGGAATQRYSTERQIDTKTVSGLQVAWRFHTHVFDKASTLSNPRASFEATPVLWNDTLYFDTPFDTIFAVDAATGALKWTFDPQVNRDGPIYIVTSRGVALWHAKKPGPGVCESDTVLVATLDRRLIARDATTGKACPRFGNGGTVDLAKGVEIAVSGDYEFTSPPTVVGETIVLGSTVADNQTIFAASGAVRGFDAATGRQKWSWEPLRWVENQKPRQAGSGNAWSVIAGDAANDLVFVPTGSASLDYYGATRLGDNRDADSIVALRASTGERVWAYQLVHHDLWDYDTPAEPVLFTFRGKIPAVAVATKTNMVYVFNRLTGEPLYPIIERPVPPSTMPGETAWPTQPFSTLPPLAPLSFTTADLHLSNPVDQADCVSELNQLDNRGIFTPVSNKGTFIYPGGLGGANWGSSALDPTTGVLYTRVSELPFFVRQMTPGEVLRFRASRYLHKHLGMSESASPTPAHGTIAPDSGSEEHAQDEEKGTSYYLIRAGLESRNGAVCAPPPYGSIVAMNLNTGVKVWSVPHGSMVSTEPGSIGAGGVIATAGGLVFGASTNDAFLRAYASESGKELWRGALPVPANATPMTYAVNGRQFVVIAAGGHGFIGKGQSDEVVAFALPAATAKPVRPKTGRR